MNSVLRWGKSVQNINPVIRLLILSDVLMISGAGLLGPIFALFVDEFILGTSATVAGIAATIYLITKSIVQIPVSILIDRYVGESDDYWVLVAGTFGLALYPLAYILVQTPMQLYIVQFVYGVMAAANFPAYMAIFTRHIDKNKEGLEWGVYYTLVDLGSAATAFIGAELATAIGYKWVIVGVVLIKCIGSCLILRMHKYLQLRPVHKLTSAHS
jgi:MFS family permease